MALTRLSKLKTVLNLDLDDSTSDEGLKEFIRRANHIIRTHCNRFLYGLVERITSDTVAIVTSVGHGLVDGDVVRFYDTGDDQVGAAAGVTVTVIDEDQFSIAVDQSGDEPITKGHYVKRVTEYLKGTGKREVTLTQLPVVNPVLALYLDGNGYFGDGTSSPFGSTTQLTLGSDFAVEWGPGTDEQSSTGTVYRTSGCWPDATLRSGSELTGVSAPALGNIKAQYWTGYRRVPRDVQTAADSFIARIIQTIKVGGGLQSESLDYYSYTRVSPEEERGAIDSIKSMLKKHKTWVI